MSIGTSEIFLCLVIALLVLGPEKLPGAARQVGRFMAEFKRITGDVQSQVQDFIKEDPEANQPARPAAPATASDATASTPPVAGRPANAPNLPNAVVDPDAPQPAPPVEPPAPQHPGIEGFRLIDDSAARKPATPPEPEKPAGSNE